MQGRIGSRQEDCLSQDVTEQGVKVRILVLLVEKMALF